MYLIQVHFHKFVIQIEIYAFYLGLSEKLFIPTVSPATTLPPYIEPAHNWLLKNLHNPYPSKKAKSSIALETGASLKDLDSWFISVRKRIGWNKLRLKHYANKRSKIVEAATRFFKEIPQPVHREPYNICIPAANHDSEFEEIKNCAKELYSGKIYKASLEKLDGAVRDLSSETKVHAHGEEERRRPMAKSRRGKDLQRLSTYPSPERSPERSPEPSLVESPEPLAPSPPPSPPDAPSTSCKRRNSDRDSPELDVEDCRDEPQKRGR